MTSANTRESREICCVMPWPPSTNNLYPSGKDGTRHKSEEAKSYHKAVADQVMVKCVRRHYLEGRLAVTLGLSAPDARTYDIDNRVKAVLDALQAAGVIAEDSHVDELHVTRQAPGYGLVSVAIYELRNQQ